MTFAELIEALEKDPSDDGPLRAYLREHGHKGLYLKFFSCPASEKIALFPFLVNSLAHQYQMDEQPWFEEKPKPILNSANYTESKQPPNPVTPEAIEKVKKLYGSSILFTQITPEEIAALPEITDPGIISMKYEKQFKPLAKDDLKGHGAVRGLSDGNPFIAFLEGGSNPRLLTFILDPNDNIWKTIASSNPPQSLRAWIKRDASSMDSVHPMYEEDLMFLLPILRPQKPTPQVPTTTRPSID